ncbi:MAG TPA: OsmC family protein [Thermoanaerobaculia bacterium]|nr:OsmC family protein [Thermoanaerobaculia bacterium]
MAGDEVHRFTASASWVGDGLGCGNVKLPQGDVSFPIGGSKKLGGCGVGANPEEMFLAAVAACFVNTWAIFLGKLKVPYPQPSVRISGDLGPDPAGGFKLLKAIVYAVVPTSLLASQREQVEKTLTLSEKYCIISKVAKAAMPLEVVIEEA